MIAHNLFHFAVAVVINKLSLLRIMLIILFSQYRNVQCGTLQCKEGERQPVNDGIDQLYSRTIISIKGQEYECKCVAGERVNS